MPLLAPLLLAAALDSSSCYFHEPTGLEFPAAPAPLTCSLEPLNCAADEIEVSYWGLDRQELMLSIFVYQKVAPCSSPNETLKDHLAGVRAAAAENYRKLQCRSWKPEGRSDMVGLRCEGESPRLGGRMVTFIGLEERDGWWLKIRATMRAEKAAVGERYLRTIVQGIQHRPSASP